MKKRIFIASFIAVTLSLTLLSSHLNNKSTSVLSLANVEALADNTESTTTLTCLGLFGWCSYNCPKCGVGWGALGSTMLGKHKCSTK